MVSGILVPPLFVTLFKLGSLIECWKADKYMFRNSFQLSFDRFVLNYDKNKAL